MNAQNAALFAGAAAVFVAASFQLRTRLPKSLVTVLIGGVAEVAGAAVLRSQPAASPAEWVFAAVVLGTVIPFNVRMLLGPFGRPAEARPAAG